ncbi:serine carboxypeptidase [Colletotrichum zoysiae]|uniref:Carboxypeptidase n=1 Tax=Colletotrichum zoysiae TaxID=1216348 RepID=A0AAD9HP59_9PEZI|nr:serine carboxypeptidase [Colletotrichum zoysiae]
MKPIYSLPSAVLCFSSAVAGLVMPKTYAVDRSYSIMSEAGTNLSVFEHAATNSRTRFVENSGICETTKGVKQYSGYFDVGTDQHTFFWFFEARNNASTAPLALWLSGGPGCSSMLGLFQENGPCTFNKGGGAEPTLNPNSWNNFANMLYVDQPIGAGFSYGSDKTTSTVKAAPQVWGLMQSFYSRFPEYKNRDFGLFTESYGGHFGPDFADYFEDQNAKIDKATQYRNYLDYAVNNTYNKLIDQRKYNELLKAYEKDCEPDLKKCTQIEGQNDACVAAEKSCYNAVEAPIESAKNFNVYDIRSANGDFPSDAYAQYLQRPEVRKAIGVTSPYDECADAPYDRFASTGDGQRSFLSKLQDVAKTDVQVLIWAGDSDWICNYVGNYNVVKKIGGEEFEKAEMKDFNLGGKKRGEYKTVKNLSWLRVYEAGHEIPAYQPEVAFEVFRQTMSKKPISSS